MLGCWRGSLDLSWMRPRLGEAHRTDVSLEAVLIDRVAAVVVDRHRQKWNWMLGQANSGRVRMKPPASNWLLAPMPLPANSHCAPMPGWLSSLSAGYSDTGWVQAYCRYISR